MDFDFIKRNWAWLLLIIVGISWGAYELLTENPREVSLRKARKAKAQRDKEIREKKELEAEGITDIPHEEIKPGNEQA